MLNNNNDKGIIAGFGPLFLTPFGRSHLYCRYSLSGFYKKSSGKIKKVLLDFYKNGDNLVFTNETDT